MKTSPWAACLVAAVAAAAAPAQTNRYVLMESTTPSEFGWEVSRPSKINGEAEGRVLALAAVNGQINGMANIEAFEQFSKAEVKKTLSNKLEKAGDLIRNTTTFTSEDRREDAFKANQRGLVVTVQEKGFKPGTFTNSSDYNKLTGVRKSRASGILLYTFKVYAPEGYSPKPGGQDKPGKPPAGDDPAPAKPKPNRIEYSILNDTDRDVRFRLPSGKEYALKPGQVGQYYNTHSDKPTITVLPTGKTYSLRDGNHKFWWMAKENRVGLDLNFQK